MKVVVFGGEAHRILWSVELSRKEMEKLVQFVEQMKKRGVEYAGKN
jgi:hypothetical protein